MNINPDARHALGEKSLRIWRLIATSRQGQTLADLVERFKGVYDEEVIKNTVASLRQSKYCEAQGLGRGSRTTITGKLPLGEELPAWWTEAVEVEPHATAPVTTTGVASIFQLGDLAAAAAPPPQPGDTDAADAKPQDAAIQVPRFVPRPATAVAAKPPRRDPAPTVRFNPLFSLDSAGRLRIEATGTQVVQLDPDDTRALFRWLDQLGGTDLQHLVEREAA